jgi:hypothetical protein
MPVQGVRQAVTMRRATRGVARHTWGFGVPVVRGGGVVDIRSRYGDGKDSEHGAAAVEMALVLPLLILLLGGIIDYGLMLNAQVSLTHAAREGVRLEAIGTGDPIQAAADAYQAPGATALSPVLVRACPNDDGALLRTGATYNYFFLPLGSRTLGSEAVMRCGG